MRFRVASGLLLSTLALAPTRAHAQSLDPEQRTMQTRMEHYFEGEKTEGYVFLGLGLAAAGSSVFLYTREDRVARGAAYPIAAVSLIQIAAGAVLLVRTDGQVADLETQIAKDPAGYRRDETRRMDAVSREFTWLTWGEIALIAAGAGLGTYGALAKKDTLEGVGIGLAAQSAVMLTLDLFASARAERYRDDLARFHPTTSSASPLGFYVPVGARF